MPDLPPKAELTEEPEWQEPPMIEEVEVEGIKYRGPLPTHSKDIPWKITVLRPSDKIGESGQVVGMSWQTYKKFSTAEESAGGTGGN